MDILIVFFTMQMLLISAIEDLQSFKIPNYITFGTMSLGLIMLFVYPKSITDVIAICVGIVVLFVIACFKIMGMGDVKLYMAILLLNGALISLFTLFISSILLIVCACISHSSEVKRALNGIKYRYEAPVKRKYPFAVFTFFGYAITTVLHCYSFF